MKSALKRILIMLIVFVFMLNIFFFTKNILLGNVALGIEEEYALGEKLTGTLNLIIDSGDLIQQDTLIVIKLSRDEVILSEKTIPIFQFLEIEPVEISKSQEVCENISVNEEKEVCGEINENNESLQVCHNETSTRDEQKCSTQETSDFYFNQQGTYSRNIQDFIDYNFIEAGSYLFVFSISSLNLTEQKTLTVEGNASSDIGLNETPTSTPSGGNENVTETVNETIALNQTLKESINQTINETKTEASQTTKRAKIVIGRPVKWLKTVQIQNNTDTEIRLPKQAENISIRTGGEIKQAEKEMIDYENIVENIGRDKIISGGLTGYVSLDIQLKKGILTRLWDWLKSWTVTGNVIKEKDIQNDITETSDSKIVDLEQVATSNSEVAVEYYTPGPVSSESETESGKEVVISAPDELNYTDVLSYTELDNKINMNEPYKIKLIWKNEGGEVKFDYYDLDKDGNIDYIEWQVPHLSDQVYELIYITKAVELDSNRTFLRDVYDYVIEKDDNWTTIDDGNYLRVSFEINLTSERDITLYARGSGSVEVYEENQNELITTFNISGENTYKNYLTSLSESQDVFDLRSAGDIEYDYVVDPFTDNSSLIQNIDDCGILSTANAVYNQNASIIALISPCINISAENITFNGNGYWIMNKTSSGPGTAVYSNQNYTIIKNTNLSMSRSPSVYGSGIYIVNASNVKIYNNTLFNQSRGVYLLYSDSVEISNNTIVWNDNDGIRFDDSNNMTVSQNLIDLNSYGILLNTGANITLDGNNISNSSISNLYIAANYLTYVIVPSNFVNGKRVYYNTSIRDYVYDSDSASDPGTFYCINCTNIIIKDANLSVWTDYKIYLRDSINSTVENVSGESSLSYMIYLYNSNYSSFKDISFSSSSSGILYLELSNFNNFNNSNFYNSSSNMITLSGAIGNNFTGGLFNKSSLDIINLLGFGSGAIANTTFKDILIEGSATANYDVNSGGVFTPIVNTLLINVSYNISKESVSAGDSLIRKWYYKAYVSDSTGLAVVGANVTAFNVSDSYNFNLTTDATGFTQLGQIVDYVNTGTRSYYSNYTIYASNVTLSANHTFNASLGNNYEDVFTITDGSDPILVLNCAVLSIANTVYNQTGNIVPLSSPCINISAENVTFNGNGFYVANTTFAGIGIYSNQFNTTIYNANISMKNEAGGAGILLEGANNSQIYNNTLSSQYYGLFTNFTSNLKVQNNTFSSNNQGAHCELTTYSVFYNNTFSAGNYGINLLLSNNTNITSNRFSATGEYGWGIYLQVSSFSNVINNSFTSKYAIHLGTSSYVSVTNNSIISSITAIQIQSASDNNIFLLNNIQAVTQGIESTSDAPKCRNNTFTNNYIDTTTLDAFYSLNSAGNDTFRNNVINNVGRYGIYLTGKGFVATNNSFNVNTNAIVLTGVSDSVLENNILFNCTDTTSSHGCLWMSATSGVNISGGMINVSAGNGIYFGSTLDANNTFRDFPVYNSVLNDTFLAAGTNSNENNIFLNVTYSTEYVSQQTGELIRKWYYRAYVNDSLGNAVNNVNVTAYNITGNYNFNLTTDATGFTQLGQITDYINNGNRTDYSNYTIYVSNITLSTNHSFNTSLGNNYKDVFTLTLPVISVTPPVTPPGGGGGGCIASSWKCGNWTGCVNGSEGKICVSNCNTRKTETKNCSQTCNYVCGEWGNCINGEQEIACSDGCGLENKEERLCKENCAENWNCSWSACSGGASAPECIDLNNCGTEYRKPREVKCEKDSCIPDVECEPWGECFADYSVDDMITGSLNFDGKMTRVCRDLGDCAGVILDEKKCKLAVPVRVVEEIICGEEIVSIYDLSGKLMVKLKKTGIGDYEKIDTLFSMAEFSNGCCDNHKKDNGEEGIDCGGSCKPCVEKPKKICCKWNEWCWISNPGCCWICWIIVIILVILLIVILRKIVKKRKPWGI